MSYEALFFRRNYAQIDKKIVMERKPSAEIDLFSALGALGRRFQSCRPDSNNPSHRKVSQPFFFIA